MSCCDSGIKLDSSNIKDLELSAKHTKIPDNFVLSKQELAYRSPIDLQLTSGSIKLKNSDFKDNGTGYTELTAGNEKRIKRIKIYRNWEFEVLSDQATFKTMTSEKKNETSNNYIENKFSFFILAIALIGSAVAVATHLDPLMVFCAVLMCICPCIFLQADAGINHAVEGYLKHKGLVYTGNNLMQTLSKAKNAKEVCDINGTIVDNALNREQSKSDNPLRQGVKLENGKLTVFDKEVIGLSGSATITANNIHSNLPPNAKLNQLDADKTYIYIGNGENDIEISKQPQVVSIAIAKASTSLKFMSDFVSTSHNDELKNFTELSNIAKKATNYKIFLYVLAIIYSITIIPLVLLGIVSPMLACIAMSVAGVSIMMIAKIFRYFLNTPKITTEAAIEIADARQALKNMAYAENGRIKSNFYSDVELKAQLQAAAIVPKQQPRKVIATTIITLLLAFSFVKIIAIQTFLYYAAIPIAVLLLACELSEVNYVKIAVFVFGAALIIASEFILPKIKPKLANVTRILGLALAASVLFYLYNNGLNMYEVQISAMILLAIANYSGIASMHMHHILIMALVLIASSFIKQAANNSSAVMPAFSANQIANLEEFAKQAKRGDPQEQSKRNCCCCGK